MSNEPVCQIVNVAAGVYDPLNVDHNPRGVGVQSRIVPGSPRDVEAVIKERRLRSVARSVVKTLSSLRSE